MVAICQPGVTLMLRAMINKREKNVKMASILIAERFLSAI